MLFNWLTRFSTRVDVNELNELNELNTGGWAEWKWYGDAAVIVPGRMEIGNWILELGTWAFVLFVVCVVCLLFVILELAVWFGL